MLAGALALLGLGWGLWQQAQGPVKPGDRALVVVTVPAGASARQVAALLQQRGVVRSAWAFLWLAEQQGIASRLKAGPYQLSPGWDLKRVVRHLADGDLLLYRVTIPEGLTVMQAVGRLVHAHLGSRRQFLAVIRHGLPGLSPPAGVRDPMEGFLFPDTYLIPAGTPPAQVIRLMWQDFQRRTAPLIKELPADESVWQWVTLASIVQAEDAKPADAPLIAAVFVNRLQQGMPLQSDATVRYALDRPVDGRLTLADLGVASPYNTYQHLGLPPGPIDCPGLMALEAALHPAHVPYLYFVGTPTGGDLFATTYAQHLANVAKVQAMASSQP